MSPIKILTGALLVFSLFRFDAAQAADKDLISPVQRRETVQISANCSRVWTCRGDLCGWKRVCWRGCPDRYSCAPLYGAYGPYGGRGYWGAYGYSAPLYR